MDWTQFLNKEMANAYAATEKLIDKVEPDSLGWKPATGANWMTMGQLLKHITEACGVGCKGFVTGEWGLPEGKTWKDLTPEEMFPPAEKLPSIDSVAQARDLLEKDRALAFEMINEAGEDNLANRNVAAPWSPAAPCALGFHLLKMIEHLERHEGQLFYYLKLRGKPVNTVDLWGEM